VKFSHNDITLLLVTLFGALALGDVVTTRFVLMNGGVELNAFMVPFVADPVQFSLVKIFFTSIIVLLAIAARCFHRKGDHIVLSVVCSIGIAPVIWNTFILWVHFGIPG
jgi:hypothetical protein